MVLSLITKKTAAYNINIYIYIYIIFRVTKTKIRADSELRIILDEDHKPDIEKKHKLQNLLSYIMYTCLYYKYLEKSVLTDDFNNADYSKTLPKGERRKEALLHFCWVRGEEYHRNGK